MIIIPIQKIRNKHRKNKEESSERDRKKGHRGDKRKDGDINKTKQRDRRYLL